jgi:hypothetical protein
VYADCDAETLLLCPCAQVIAALESWALSNTHRYVCRLQRWITALVCNVQVAAALKSLTRANGVD